MALPDKKTLEFVKRLQNARLDLLRKQPFYALLLMHMKFALDNTVEHSYTDGNHICFNPDFLCEIDDDELEFVLMHNVLHAALSHPFRVQSDYDLEVFDEACDIVVNSNILYSFAMDISKITLKKYGVMPHVTPSGKEGYELTLEQVYNELMHAKGKKPKTKQKSAGKIKGMECSNCQESDRQLWTIRFRKGDDPRSSRYLHSAGANDKHRIHSYGDGRSRFETGPCRCRSRDRGPA